MKKHIVLLCPIFLCAAVFAESLPIDAVMSEKDQKEIGINKLSTPQLRALEEWAGNWTRKVLNEAYTYHPSQNLEEWVLAWPNASIADLENTSADDVNQPQAGNNRIDKNRDEGAILELKDGSIWRIAEVDRYKTRLWQRGDTITATKTNVYYPPYQLTNSISRSPTLDVDVAGAEMIQGPSENGRSNGQSEDSYNETSRISSVDQKGWQLSLEDGSNWNIAPRYWSIVKWWKKADRVRAKKGNNYLYPYILENTDSGEEVMANSQ